MITIYLFIPMQRGRVNSEIIEDLIQMTFKLSEGFINQIMLSAHLVKDLVCCITTHNSS